MKKQTILAAILLISVMSNSVLGQKLSDTMFNNMSRVEMGQYFSKKSNSFKAGGYTLIGVGAASIIAASAMMVDDFWGESSNYDAANALGYIGLGCIAASYPVLSVGAKFKGRAEMLFMNPDPQRVEQLTREYARKAKTNSIIAWSLLGTGIIVPLLLQPSDGYSGTGETAQTVSTIATIGIFVSIPFFMEAAKNKGRVSILTRSEKIPYSSSGSINHRSLGIGFPIGK